MSQLRIGIRPQEQALKSWVRALSFWRNGPHNISNVTSKAERRTFWQCFFGSDEELVKKARYYLENPREREQIAQRGYEKCREKFSWEKYMRADWAKVRELMAKREASRNGRLWSKEALLPR